MSILSQSTPLPTPMHTHVHKRELTIHGDLTGYIVAVGLVLTSQLALFIRPAFGAYVTVAALALLMVMAATYDRVRAVILSLALVPLIGMIDLSVIAHSAFEQTAVLYTSMLVLSLVYRYVFRGRIKPVVSHMKLPGYAVFVPLAIGVGLGVGAITYLLLKNGYVFGSEAIYLVGGLGVLGAFAEESLFRGLIQRQAADIMDVKHAAVLTSLVYAGATFSHFSGWAILAGLVSALVLSLSYVVRPNLIITTTLNVVSKLTYVSLVGFLLIR